MALMLANRGHQVRVFERRPDPRIASPERGRSINLAMAARGLAASAHAGLAARLAPLLMPMPGRMLHQEDGSLQFLAYGSKQQEVIYAVSREQLNRLLIEAAAECPRIELRFDTRCLDVDPTAGMCCCATSAAASRAARPLRYCSAPMAPAQPCAPRWPRAGCCTRRRHRSITITRS